MPHFVVCGPLRHICNLLPKCQGNHGDRHVVFKGNILGVKATGNGVKTGKLGQNDEIAEELWTKYFSTYVNK